MASQVFASLEVTLFRGLNLIRCNRLGHVPSKCAIQDYSICRGRQFSTSTCYSNKSDDSNSPVVEPSQQDPRSRKRDDLERLKQLLFHAKSPSGDTNKQEANIKRAKVKQVEKSPGVSVDASKFKDILSSLKPGSTPLPPSKGKRAEPILSPSVPSGEETIKVETRKTNNDFLPDNLPLSVDVSKMKDALSILGQDRSSSPAEDVILAGRGQQLSPERLSAMEGVLNIKQRQIQDKNNKQRMSQNLLRIGPRFHWFDEVKTMWSNADLSFVPTLFQDMAEKEVHDMGTSISFQSGFQDLVENINRQWAFPIDNETCKTEEKHVGFDQHVFLEYLLDEFPKSGNIRQFMELVITGLQQNPHLNVKEKKEHILWFKEYFENMPDELVQI